MGEKKRFTTTIVTITLSRRTFAPSFTGAARVVVFFFFLFFFVHSSSSSLRYKNIGAVKTLHGRCRIFSVRLSSLPRGRAPGLPFRRIYIRSAHARIRRGAGETLASGRARQVSLINSVHAPAMCVYIRMCIYLCVASKRRYNVPARRPWGLLRNFGRIKRKGITTTPVVCARVQSGSRARTTIYRSRVAGQVVVGRTHLLVRYRRHAAPNRR